MKWIEVSTSPPLRGAVDVPGSKNSALALMAAACLADEPVVLSGVPKLKDFIVIQDMCRDIGANVYRDNDGTIRVDAREVTRAFFDPEKSGLYRASYYYVGALLAKTRKVSIGYPGGDDFGGRPMEQHFKGLRALGAKVTLLADRYVVECDKLEGAEVYYDVVTMGGTINVMLAAVLADGITVLRNASRDPEVVDVANLLNQMGARIRGAGTDVIRIEGVRQLGGAVHTVIPDRLIAGTYLIGAAATGGEVTVRGAIPEHLRSCLAKLSDIGVECVIGDNQVTARSVQPLRPGRVRTSAYPGFATDLQQPMTAAFLRAQGRSLIVDTVYPNRTSHIPQLRRMGADIEQRKKGVVIQGGGRLQGAWVRATDVRAGACLMLAGMIAEGTTFIAGVEHIERGYEDAVQSFSALGANLRWAEGDVAAREVQLPW